RSPATHQTRRQHPPDHDCDWGRESYRAWLAKAPLLGQEDSNGAVAFVFPASDVGSQALFMRFHLSDRSFDD
ncbi:hypothetical protein KDW65_12755, partial [Burkholderia cenocepacia]|uniref:hypothetical protein n=1 Tax=Burkholderia cenocepacia TaxID=95486 RepID=UPI001B9F6F7D